MTTPFGASTWLLAVKIYTHIAYEVWIYELWKHMKLRKHIFCLLQLCRKCGPKWCRLMFSQEPPSSDSPRLRVVSMSTSWNCMSWGTNVIPSNVAQDYSHVTPLPVVGKKNGLLTSRPWWSCRLFSAEDGNYFFGTDPILGWTPRGTCQ